MPSPSIERCPALADPAQFYTGLVADLYEPLISETAQADTYIPFLDRAGTPALELACGSGLPLVELVERGYEVEGLDSSEDMLERCRERAVAAGVEVTLHRAPMQDFTLARRYAAMFLAGASFTLLPSDAAAAATLRCMHDHLLPGGAVLIPLEILDLDTLREATGRPREARAGSTRLRVTVVSVEPGEDGRSGSIGLRYERMAEGSAPEVVERGWQRRWWPQDTFREMLVAAGFREVAFASPEGGPADSDAAIFVALARGGASPSPPR